MDKVLKALTPTKRGAAVVGSTVGLGGSIAWVLISAPSDLGWFTFPADYIPHMTAIIIGVWNRTGGKWLLS